MVQNYPQGQLLSAPITNGAATALFGTHIDILGVGGLRTVETLTDRDAIVTKNKLEYDDLGSGMRRHLMVVSVSATEKQYIHYVPGLNAMGPAQRLLALKSNAYWIEYPTFLQLQAGSGVSLTPAQIAAIQNANSPSAVNAFLTQADGETYAKLHEENTFTEKNIFSGTTGYTTYNVTIDGNTVNVNDNYGNKAEMGIGYFSLDFAGTHGQISIGDDQAMTLTAPHIAVSQDPTRPLDIATKQYVDNALAGFSGGTSGGTIDDSNYAKLDQRNVFQDEQVVDGGNGESATITRLSFELEDDNSQTFQMRKGADVNGDVQDQFTSDNANGISILANHFKVPTPTAPDDAATKLYVDNAISGATIDESNFVHKTGVEIIDGRKTFTTPVTITTPVADGLNVTVNNGNGGTAVAQFLSPNNFGNIFFAIGRQLSGSALFGYSAGGNFAFFTTYGRPETDFTIGNNGNVGIGTGAPQARLHVAGDILASNVIGANLTGQNLAPFAKSLIYPAANGTLQADANLTWNGSTIDILGNSGPTGFRIYNQGQGFYFYNGANGPGNFGIYDITAQLDRFILTKTGFVGIGTINPTHLLEVAGAIKGQTLIAANMAVPTGTATGQDANFVGAMADGTLVNTSIHFDQYQQLSFPLGGAPGGKIYFGTFGQAGYGQSYGFSIPGSVQLGINSTTGVVSMDSAVVTRTVTAQAFIGDGSQLTNIPKPVYYSTTGQNTDGAMTQKATTDALALKANLTGGNSFSGAQKFSSDVVFGSQSFSPISITGGSRTVSFNVLGMNVAMGPGSSAGFIGNLDGSTTIQAVGGGNSLNIYLNPDSKTLKLGAGTGIEHVKVPVPTETDDAASKQYVDQKFNQISGATPTLKYAPTFTASAAGVQSITVPLAGTLVAAVTLLTTVTPSTGSPYTLTSTVFPDFFSISGTTVTITSDASVQSGDKIKILYQ